MLDTLETITEKAQQHFLKAEYREAATLYEQAIDLDPSIRSHYWYLGLSFLLQEQEVEAQVTWMLVIGEGTPQEVEQWTQELVTVLETEAQRQENKQDYTTAWAIRQHIREIVPKDLGNLFKSILLSLKTGQFSTEYVQEIGIISLIQLQDAIETELAIEVVDRLINDNPFEPCLMELVEAIQPKIDQVPQLIDTLMLAAVRVSQNLKRPDRAIEIAQLCLKFDPEHLEVWRHLSAYYQNAGKYDEGVDASKKCYNLAIDLPQKLFANYLLIRGLMSAGGRWSEAVEFNDRQDSLITSLESTEVNLEDMITCTRMYTTAFFFPYFQDDLKKHRSFHNKLAKISQYNTEKHEKERIDKCRKNNLLIKSRSSKKIRIGYVSHTFASHSVGWLCRWLFSHHDRDKYEIYGYFINYRFVNPDPVQEWFVSQMTQARKLGMSYPEVVDTIVEDDLNILVDLDSITLDITCATLAIKPAPIQISWLGWDAPGLPTVDYMIADPYVLPENAQDYYSEKLWRLPKTYIAVDGFEVGVPTLRRDHLDISGDAVIYFSSQRGYKRHPDTARLQLRIIKEVPNSYFLIKGFGDQDSIKTFFLELAEEEGVSGDRLRFLSSTVTEAQHRANLGIADVVLDTYPYNGATTTLETLWMCIPLVTRVGQQFAARNSYTMMVNAGITEGIAWSDREYVDWGIRLGQDPQLRQTIAWKLRISRQTAPLWNAKEFTREMEIAYDQMWTRYVESGI